MPTPVRIQLSRKKGFRLQEVSRAINGLEAVNCARPGKWGNPHRIDLGRGWDAAFAVREYRFDRSMNGRPPTPEVIRRELRGKNLACFCKLGDPCHADVLLELANKDSLPAHSAA